jgi:hypothetical protein
MVYGYKLGTTGRSFNRDGIIVGDRLIHLVLRHKRDRGDNSIVGVQVKMEKSAVDNDTSICIQGWNHQLSSRFGREI